MKKKLLWVIGASQGGGNALAIHKWLDTYPPHPSLSRTDRRLRQLRQLRGCHEGIPRNGNAEGTDQRICRPPVNLRSMDAVHNVRNVVSIFATSN